VYEPPVLMDARVPQNLGDKRAPQKTRACGLVVAPVEALATDRGSNPGIYTRLH
jgi:hypothetical protein